MFVGQQDDSEAVVGRRGEWKKLTCELGCPYISTLTNRVDKRKTSRVDCRPEVYGHVPCNHEFWP